METVTTPCREWRGAQKGPGAKHGKGYGNVYRQGRYWSLHRYIWTLIYGPIPDGMVIMHLCDNPPCFRLDHLVIGTMADNMADKVAKGRASGGRHEALKTHCPQGHPYDEANTYRRPSNPNRRDCRACQYERNRSSRARRERPSPGPRPEQEVLPSL